ncbi:MAG: NADPH:quinone reductase [Spirochaetaceae bacterium]|nr:MAG: NADPH:quinone reductase [Spirochaetaceae bacterium]
MKAVVVREFGPPSVLKVEDVPDPVAQNGQIVVALHATGVNPVETYQRSGSQGYDRPRPFTPGADGAGVIESIGRFDAPGPVSRSGVRLAVGQRVYVSGSVTGTYAEKCVCTRDQVHPLSDSLSFEQGACLWINYGTAYRALFQRGGAIAGEWVLIHGATGGVGVAAIQWAKLRGLRVIGSYGTPRGRELLESLGVDHAIAHGDDGHLDSVDAATAGHGIDVVVEMLANVNLEADLNVLARGGRVVVVGSRGSIEVTPRRLMAREADVRGVMLYGASDTELTEIHAAIAAAADAGAIEPVIQESLPLARAADAHEIVMNSPSHGKIVLTP